jgi:D-inositol-3-phosphate glycosyltransferase
MHLATNIPFVRRKLQLTESDTSGSAAAHTDVVVNSLRHKSVESVSLVSDFGAGGNRSADFEMDCDDSFRDLLAEFGQERVRRVQVAQVGEHVWLTKMPLALQYAQMRDAIDCEMGPTCSLVHAVNLPSLMAAHVALWCLQEPYDVFVVTSSAAERALTAVIRQTGTLLQQRFGIASLTDVPAVVKIPLGVDPSEYTAIDRKLARRILGMSSSMTYLLYFGRLDSRYKADLDPLLQAFQHLRQNDAEIHLILAGFDSTGVTKRQLANLADQLGIGHAVTIVTNIAPPMKKLLYSAADVFVSPVDNIQESFGLTLLEAMSMGLPVVASDWSGYRDIVVDGSSGLLVTTLWNASVERRAEFVGPAAYVSDLEAMVAEQTIVDVGDLVRKLQSVIIDPFLRLRLGAEGRRRAEEVFSWERVCVSFGDLWEQQRSDYTKARRVKRESVKHLRYGEIFAGYASQSLDEGCSRNLRHSERGDQWLANGVSRLEMPTSSSFTPENVRNVLNATQRPRPMQEIIATFGSPERAALAWLLKKNALVWEGHRSLGALAPRNG